MRLLLIYLSILNLLDAFFTMYGLDFHHISEINRLMDSLYNTSPWLFLLLKGGLSLFLITLIYKLNPDQRPSNLLLSVSVIAAVSYSFTLLVHIYWLLEVL